MANNQARLEDNICPICMYIFIQPVTMPCGHELCLPCFKQNVEEANLCCPLCRVRISTWARRASRNKKLVNQQRWEEIQRNFPEKIQKRINGEDDDDDMDVMQISIQLAEPGEIRMEYEDQLRKLQEQALAQKQKEVEASEALIRQLQEEEEQKKRLLDEIRRRDEELARTLSAELNEKEDNSPYLMRGSANSRSNSSNSIETFINKMKEKETHGDQVIPRGNSPYPYRCYTPPAAGKLRVDRDKVLELEDSFKRQNIETDKKLLTTQDILDLEQRYRNSNTLRLKSNTSSTAVVGCLGETSRTCSRSDSVIIVDTNEILNQMSEDLITENQVCDIEIDIESKADEVEKERSSSVQSNDSITQELSHFRPIRACPLTPPRKLASGKFVEAPLIRTTPRNLSKTGLGSPTTTETNLSDIDASSPIMQRRLSILAEERKFQVRRMSKSTATELEQVDDDHENRNPGRTTTRDPSPELSQTHNSSVIPRTTEFKDISNSPLQKRKLDPDPEFEELSSPAKKKLIIPLEANLDESDDLFSHSAVNFVTVKTHDRTSRSKSLKSNGSVDRKGENVNGKNNEKASNLSKEVQKKRSRNRSGKGHTGKVLETRSEFSPQRSITDFMTKANSSACGSNGLSTHLLSVGVKGRDEEGCDAGRRKNQSHRAVISRKNQYSTLDKFVTKTNSKNSPTVHKKTRRKTAKSDIEVDGNSEDSRSPDKRYRKELRHSDYVYYTSPKKSNMELVENDIGDVRRALDLDPTENGASNDGFASDGDSESDDSFRQIKNTNNRKAVKRKGRVVDSTEPDCILSQKRRSKLSDTEPSTSELVTVSKALSQEEQDRLMALELQRQFEFEAKLKLNAVRLKGTDDAYLFRSRRK